MVERKSGFVTALAWVLLVAGAIATIGGTLQAALLLTLFSDVASIAAEAGFEGIRGLAFQYARAIALATVGLSAATTWAAFGLLRRREWARRIMLALAAVFVLYLGGALAFQWMYFDEVADQVPPGARSFSIVVRSASALIALALAGTTAWLARRLCSPQIREEFH